MEILEKSRPAKETRLLMGHCTLKAYLEQVKAFHGHLAPGMIMGGFMVDLAFRHLPHDILYDAVCETRACLPDAIQLLTPCTIGNGWLNVADYGRFSLTLFDKYNGKGARVWVDVEKIKPHKEIYNWFMKLTPKKEQDSDKLFARILEQGEALLSVAEKIINPAGLVKFSMGTTAICPSCGEAYPVAHGNICRACRVDH